MVIIGGGGHGLAAAYYLARDYGVTNIAVLEKGYLGGGGTGRNTAIVRSNYLTSKASGSTTRVSGSSRTSRRTSTSTCSIPSAGTSRWPIRSDAADHALAGRSKQAPGGQQLRDHARGDSQDMSLHRFRCGGATADLGASIIRRAPSSGTMRSPGATRAKPIAAASRFTRRRWSPASTCKRGQVEGVQTDRGYIKTQSAVRRGRLHAADHQMVGLRTPFVIQPLQACVTEPLKPWLNNIVVSASLHLYVSQSSRGELVMGASLDPYELHSTLDARFRRRTGRPPAGSVSVLWRCQGQPAVGRHVRHDTRLFADHGHHADRRLLHRLRLGDVGIQSDADLRHHDGLHVGRGSRPRTDRAFNFSRFKRLEHVGEKGAASVGH